LFSWESLFLVIAKHEQYGLKFRLKIATSLWERRDAEHDIEEESGPENVYDDWKYIKDFVHKRLKKNRPGRIFNTLQCYVGDNVQPLKFRGQCSDTESRFQN
jgi:hypothetical protein